MPMWLCRWPNGDCSIALAETQPDAIVKLDEVANAEGCPITVLPECQVHFRLTDTAKLELEGFGEETDETIFSECYPTLQAVLPVESPEHWTAEQRDTVRHAVDGERERITAAATPEPETELGRDMKRMLGAPTEVVDRIVRQDAGETLRKLKSPKKPH